MSVTNTADIHCDTVIKSDVGDNSMSKAAPKHVVLYDPDHKKLDS